MFFQIFLAIFQAVKIFLLPYQLTSGYFWRTFFSIAIMRASTGSKKWDAVLIFSFFGRTVSTTIRIWRGKKGGGKKKKIKFDFLLFHSNFWNRIQQFSVIQWNCRSYGRFPLKMWLCSLNFFFFFSSPKWTLLFLPLYSNLSFTSNQIFGNNLYQNFPSNFHRRNKLNWHIKKKRRMFLRIHGKSWRIYQNQRVWYKIQI